jgi:hypothetical protein
VCGGGLYEAIAGHATAQGFGTFCLAKEISMPVEPPIPQQPEAPPQEAPAQPMEPGQPATLPPEIDVPGPDIDIPSPGGDPAGAPIQPTA